MEVSATDSLATLKCPESSGEPSITARTSPAASDMAAGAAEIRLRPVTPRPPMEYPKGCCAEIRPR